MLPSLYLNALNPLSGQRTSALCAPNAHNFHIVESSSDLMILLEFKGSSSSSHFSYSAGISLWFSEAINVSEHEN
jgi:hypothetical protein